MKECKYSSGVLSFGFRLEALDFLLSLFFCLKSKVKSLETGDWRLLTIQRLTYFQSRKLSGQIFKFSNLQIFKLAN
jgi:hypothetical protein